MIYFAQAGEDGPVKIGFSANPWQRLGFLRWQTKTPLELRRVQRGERARERAFHLRFGALRISGEWFRPEGELLTLLESSSSPKRPPFPGVYRFDVTLPPEMERFVRDIIGAGGPETPAGVTRLLIREAMERKSQEEATCV